VSHKLPIIVKCCGKHRCRDKFTNLAYHTRSNSSIYKSTKVKKYIHNLFKIINRVKCYKSSEENAKNGGKAKISKKPYITSPKMIQTSVFNEEKATEQSEIYESGSGPEATLPKSSTGIQPPNVNVPPSGGNSYTSPDEAKPAEGTGLSSSTVASISNNNAGNGELSSGATTLGSGNTDRSSLSGNGNLGKTILRLRL